MSEITPRAEGQADEENASGEAVSASPSRKRSDRKRRRKRSTFWDYVATIVVALLISVLIKTFLFQPFFIPSGSMIPTLRVDDKIVVSKLTPSVFDLHRGDVIVFSDPANWLENEHREPTFGQKVSKVLSYVGLAADPADNHLVKRLIGMPGDHLVCASRGAQLQINGVTVHEPYINPSGGACQEAFDVKVPPKHVWVMGDNRYASADSAYHYIYSQGLSPDRAFVPESAITGKAKFIMWPISRWRTLSAGEDTFAHVPAHP
ncbi:signal peptidase I [Devriesea agamarum]|uniref:signal peptidase I n=1 Tax=Devriesea agamarum TaxID=472569 RepID=UPI00071D4199|nr:signal peptidase I [Devriesea agamarum]